MRAGLRPRRVRTAHATVPAAASSQTTAAMTTLAVIVVDLNGPVSGGSGPALAVIAPITRSLLAKVKTAFATAYAAEMPTPRR
jgi:hypothetical protein